MDALNDLLQSPAFGVSLLVVVPVILGVVQALKKALNWADDQYDRWKPLLSCVVGVVMTTVMLLAQKYPTVGEWLTTVVIGLVLGLAASGLYTAQKIARSG